MSDNRGEKWAYPANMADGRAKTVRFEAMQFPEANCQALFLELSPRESTAQHIGSSHQAVHLSE
jgi:hypothetical protein